MNDFSSLDRLMELGMSMNLASQMIGTMNHALNNMQVPGQPGPRATANNVAPDAPAAQGGNPLSEVPATVYYAVVDSHVAGPMDDKQMSRLISAGTVTDQTLVWMPGLPAWKYAAEVPAVYKLILLSV